MKDTRTNLRKIVVLVCLLLEICSAWTTSPSDRRKFLEVLSATGFVGLTTTLLPSFPALADDAAGTAAAAATPVEVAVSGDAKKLFNEGRALESQGNMAAAQRLYARVTKISPRFIYGWSNLGNTEGKVTT